MTFQQLTQTRYSLRSYSPEPVTDDQLTYILQCAQQAPSAVNYQPWHFYICRTPEARRRVQQTYPRDWFASAPIYIIACIRHDQSWHRPIDEKDHGDIDIAIATEHICLAAADLGLGTCWVCNFDVQLLHRLLNLPPNEEAAAIIPLGHPTPDAAPRPTTRKPLSDIITTL